jgi:peptidoglycan/xylan/chitin deacetylase (PgdA/CDA1 family)
MKLKRRSIILSLIVVFALVFSGLGFTKIKALAAEDVRVTTANLNLRSGPGTSYAVIAVIPKGTSVTVQSTVGNWAKVTYSGKTGYSSMSYLVPVSTSVNDFRITTANLNFRSGPGTTFPILAVIPKGTTVNVISESNGWAKFTYAGKTGYSSTYYLQKVSSEDPVLYTRYTTEELNLRSGPGTSYPILKVMPKGSAVTVHRISGYWAYVTYSGTKGWCHTGYLSTGISSVATNKGLLDRTGLDIALTFDAGWLFDQAIPILDVLDDYGIKATFFLRAYWVQDHQDLAKEIKARGHSIQNHSLTHPHMNEMTEAEIRYEFTESTKIYSNILGIRPTLFRPPFGEYNSTVLKVAGEQGYPYTVLWTVDTHDWADSVGGVTVTTDYIVNRALTYASDNGIVLMHVAYAKTPEALPRIIQGLKDKGYSFRTVAEMLP